MSMTVILKAQLGVAQITSDLLQKVSAQNPSLADWIENLDTLPIIRECIDNALNRLASDVGDAFRDDYIDNMRGRAPNGRLVGALRTDQFPNGFGVFVTDRGTIEFATAGYSMERKKADFERMRKLFASAFQAEMTSAILQILGYEVEIKASPAAQGSINYNLVGVKQ